MLNLQLKLHGFSVKVSIRDLDHQFEWLVQFQLLGTLIRQISCGMSSLIEVDAFGE